MRLAYLALSLLMISSVAVAAGERWIVESTPPADRSTEAVAAVGSAALLVRADLAQLRGLTLLTREEVRPDIAALELTRLASAKGDARITLGKFARAQGLIEVSYSPAAKPSLVLRAIDLRKPDREKTFSADATPAKLEAEVAQLVIEAATFLGRTPDDAESARMMRPVFANASALAAAGEALATGDASARVARLDQATRLAPNSALAWYLLGQAQHSSGKLLDAISAYRKAISLDGESAPYHYDLGNAFFDDKRYDEAIVEYTRAMALDPHQGAPHENLVRALEAKKLKVPEVLAKYTEATASCSDIATTQMQIGLLLDRAGKPAEALAAFKKAEALAPDDPIAHFNIAHALDRMKRADEAIAEYLNAIDLAPNYAKAHNNLGFLYEQQGKQGTALFHYQQATKFAPDYPLAWNNLAICYEQRQRFALAIDAYERVVKLTPEDPIAHYNLALAHHRNGDIAPAIDGYKKALALNDDDKLAHWHLAAAYERSGMWNLANRHWKRVLALDPMEEERKTAERHIAENEKR